MKIKNLTIKVTGRRLFPVWHLSLDAGQGQRVAVVGESGGGKTSLAWAVMGCPLPGQQIEQGEVLWNRYNMQNLSLADKRELYFNKIGFLPQNAMSSFHPTRKIIASLVEIGKAPAQAEIFEKAVELGERLDLPPGVWHKYPHQLSGGQKQRIALVLALVNRPRMLVLDEPTSSLDVICRSLTEKLLLEMSHRYGAGMLLFTHDVNMAARLAQKVVVLYAGRIVEELSAEFLSQARHPYTRGLLAATLELGTPPLTRRGVPGSARILEAPPRACGFAGRCPEEQDLCRRQAPPLAGAGGNKVRCFRYAAAN